MRYSRRDITIGAVVSVAGGAMIAGAWAIGSGHFVRDVIRMAIALAVICAVILGAAMATRRVRSDNVSIAIWLVVILIGLPAALVLAGLLWQHIEPG